MPTRALVTSYEQDLERFPDRWQRLGVLFASIGCLAFPLLASARWLTVANQALVAIVGSIALMILTGFAGQISLGHAAFLALGAYTVAVLGVHWHVPFWLALPAAGMVAAAIGLAVGPFALRLRGLYLAIVTLGLLFLVDHTLLAASSWTGGVAGTPVPMHLWPTAQPGEPTLGVMAVSSKIFGVELTQAHKLYAVFLPIAVGAALLCSNVRRSRLGRAMMAVRDSDLAAEALGVHPARTKVAAFGLSSFLAGVAGGMFALQQQYLTVSPPFDLQLSVQYITMIVLGGVGTTFGAVAGPLVFVFFTPLAEMVGRELPWISRLSSAQQSTVMFAVVVCGLLIVEPLGLYGVWLRVKRYFVGWPFRY